jgi:hypothetical protein
MSIVGLAMDSLMLALSARFEICFNLHLHAPPPKHLYDGIDDSSYSRMITVGVIPVNNTGLEIIRGTYFAIKDICYEVAKCQHSKFLLKISLCEN